MKHNQQSNWDTIWDTCGGCFSSIFLLSFCLCTVASGCVHWPGQAVYIQIVLCTLRTTDCVRTSKNGQILCTSGLNLCTSGQKLCTSHLKVPRVVYRPYCVHLAPNCVHATSHTEYMKNGYPNDYTRTVWYVVSGKLMPTVSETTARMLFCCAYSVGDNKDAN